MTLPEDPWRYFKRSPGVVLLPLGKLKPSRARPQGIVNAGKFMVLAYEGKKSKREPISVRPEEGGKYTILDGNSTYANALMNGWRSIPALVVSKVAYTPRWQDHPGYKTVVDVNSEKGILPSQQESKTDTGQGPLDAAWPVQPGGPREKERALPLPSGHSKQRDKKVGPTTINKPRNVPERTLSIPGQEWGSPVKYDYNTVTRRNMEVTGTEEEDIYEEDPMDDQQVMPASDEDEHTAGSPLPSVRQKHLAPAYQRVMKNWYRINRGRKKRVERQKYRTKGKRDPQEKRYRKYYRQYPHRYKRKGRTPFTTPAERTKAWRKEQGQDADRKGITPKQQETQRKRTPTKTKSRSPKTPGGTSQVYASHEEFMAAWEMLGADWPIDWNTQTKKTKPPGQLDQNFGKGKNRDTGVPRTDPSKQKGESLRVPNLQEKHQPGLLTQHDPPASGMPSVEINNPTSGSGKVIPMSYYTDLVNNTQAIPDGRQDRYLHNNNFEVKQASTMSDILNRVDRDIQVRARDRVPTLLRTDTKNWIWHWRSGQWKVKVQAFKRGGAKNFIKLNLRVSCNCPFWRWQGPEHWAKQGDYLLGRPQGSAANPVVRDPTHHHPVCKHVYAVLEKSSRFFVRPKKSPLRKLGSRYLVDTLDSIEVQVVTEPSAAQIAQAYFHRKLIQRIAARYLAKEGS